MMKFSFKKFRAAFGDNKVAEEIDDNTYTEDIINDVEGVPFAISQTNVMYAAMTELAGYHYFKTIIIGTFEIKTFKGAKLIIKGTDYTLELQSDMVELESEVNKSANRNISRIDFEIDSDDISKISRTTVESLELISKKNNVLFSIIVVNDEEEEE